MQAKLFLKIWLQSVTLVKFTSINEDPDQSRSSVWRGAIGRGFRLYRGKFLKVNGQQPNFQE